MHTYIIPSYSQSKVYQAVLDDLVKSSQEIKQLTRSARRNILIRPKLVRIINDVLRMRFNRNYDNNDVSQFRKLFFKGKKMKRK